MARDRTDPLRCDPDHRADDQRASTRWWRHAPANLLRWVASLLFLLGILPAFAQTQLSGQVTADQRLTAAGGPYVLSGDVVVANGARLVLEAGVTVYMALGSSLRVQQGTLQADGTSSSPIKVLSDKVRQGQAGSPGDWGEWVFDEGTGGHRLQHVEFQHGRGLVLRGAAAQLDHVAVRSQAGAAITADLRSSLTGVGNSASDNAINGIALPAGDITGSVRWGLRGIPFIVTGGVVSVGASPRIATLAPSVLQVGDTAIPLVITGARLGGAARAESSLPGVSLQIQPGGTDTQLSVLATVGPTAQPGSATVRLLTDAGEAEAVDALSIRALEPRLLSVDPAEVFIDRGSVVLALTGQNLRATSVVDLDGVALSTTIVSATAATATLPPQTTAGTRVLRIRTPDASAPGGSLLSNTVPLIVSQPLPVLSPSPVSMFEGNTQVVRLTLPFAAPSGGLQFTLASSAPLVVTVQGSVTVPAGATTVDFDLRGAAIGQSIVTVSRLGWRTAQVTATVIDPPRRVNLTPITTPLVGVQVGADSSIATAQDGPYTASPVGILVGSAAARLTPSAGVIGTALSLQVDGAGLSAVTGIAAVPSTGLSFSTPTGSADGRRLTTQVTIAPDAPQTARRIVLQTATGELSFADARASQFLVTSPRPVVESISPQVLLAGGAPTPFTLRGRNFRDIQGVRVEPTADLSVVGSPQPSIDGTTLTLTLQAAGSAVAGPRTLIVVAASGESETSAGPANTFQVARSLGVSYTALTSPLVGLQVGAQDSGSTGTDGPYRATSIGVVLGQGVAGVSPRSATRGSQVQVTVQGVGLGAATSAQLEPSTGLQVGAITVAPDQRSATFTITVDFNAPLTQRRLSVATASGVPIPFADPADARFEVLAIVGQRFEAMASALVGVQVGAAQVATSSDGPYRAAPAGVIVGSGASTLAPRAGVVGSSATLVVRGMGLGAVTTVEAQPSAGLVIGVPQPSTDGARLDVAVSIAPDAPQTARRIVLRTATGEVLFADPAMSQFLVTAPVPIIESVSPQVVVAGQGTVMLAVRGRNLQGVTATRFEPAEGLASAGLPVVDAAGQLMQLPVQAAASANSGPRTLVISTPAGDSSLAPTPANTVQVARSAAVAFDALVSPVVGVQIGAEATATSATTAIAAGTGVVVGRGALSMSPMGSVKGVNGAWEFRGSSLQGITAVRLVAADGSVATNGNGVTVGTPVVSADGTQVSVPYSVDAAAANRRYRVELLAGAEVVPIAQPSTTLWQVVDQPRMDSVSPTVLQLGRSYSFVVRGQQLGAVSEIVFEAPDGITIASGVPTHATDSLGELLSVTLIVDAQAPTGPRVVRLRHPGGLTSAQPTSANVVNVVP